MTISKPQGPKHKWPFNIRTASFQKKKKKREPLVFFRSPSQRNGRPCHHCSCNNGLGVFIAKKNACHSPTIKAGEGMRTGGGERGDPRARKKEKEPRKERAEPKSHWRPRTKKRKKDQTFVPLFLLKETEEVKEKKATNRGQNKGKEKGGHHRKAPGETQNRGKNRKNFRSSVSSQRNRGGHGERPRAAEEESS
jgi:hypothetical protein